MKSFPWTSVVAAAALLPAAALAQSFNNWQTVDGSADGSMADAAHWSSGVPTLGHYAVFPGGLGSYTVGIPETFVLKSNLRVNAVAGETVTLDWRDSLFSQPTLTGADEAYSPEPFSFRFDGKHFWNFQSYSLSGTHAVSEVSNALIRLSVPDGNPRLDFDQGAYDFLTPCGSDAWGAYTMLFANGASVHAVPSPAHASVYFHEGTDTTLGQMYVQGNAATNLLCFDGGTHAIKKTLNVPSTAQTMTDQPTRTVIRVKDTAHLTVDGAVVFGGTSTYYGNTRARTFSLEALDGGTLELNGAMTQDGGGRLGVSVANGASLTVGASFHLANTAFTTARVDVADATFAVKPGVTVYVGNPEAEPSSASFSATNATLDLKGSFTVRKGAHRIVGSDVDVSGSGKFDLQGDSRLEIASSDVDFTGMAAYTFGGASSADALLRFADCDVTAGGNVGIGAGTTVFDGSSVAVTGSLDVDAGTPSFSNSVVQIGGAALFEGGTTVFHDCVVTAVAKCVIAEAAGTRATVTIGGASSFCSEGALHLGYQSNACGELRLLGGDHVFKGSLYAGWNGTGVLHVAGANVDNIAAGSGDAFAYLGVGSAKAFGRLVVSGGRFTANGTQGIQLGWTGAGELLVSGGTVETSRIRLGSGSGTPLAPCDAFVQTGGFVDIARQDDGYGLVVAVNAGRTGHVALDGGVLRCGRVYGGSGDARLTADGGTIRVPGANKDFFRGFDSAELGGKGLTVESDFAVTLAQDFSCLPDSAGRLVLSGTGAKTLTGANTVLSNLVVSGGSAVLPAGAAFGAITATDGGAVAFDPAAASVSLPALTLGEDGGTGVLTLRQGQTLSIGRMTVRQARVAFAGDFPSGDDGTDYPLVTVTEPMDDASKSAWEEAFVEGGLAAGDTAVFAWKTENGVTTLSAHVRKASQLVVSLDEGTSNVTEDIVFTANESLTALVARDADLAFTGTLSRGAFVKAGEGRASLGSSANAFLRGVTVESGLLSVADPAMLGLWPPNAWSGLTLAGGTLEITGPASGASFDKAAELAAPDATNGVIVKCDAPVVMPAPTGPGAALIKRGTEPLVIEAAGTVDFPFRGHDPFGYSPKAETTVFDDNGTVPGGFYGGLNVVEGDLVLTGADGKHAVFNAYGSICIGLPTLSCGVNPTLVLDNVAVENKLSGSRLFFGCNMRPSISSATAATLVLTNGARFVADTVLVNYSYGSNASDVSVRLDADASELIATYMLNAGYGAWSCDLRYTFRNGSRLLAANCTLNGGRVVFDFDASVFAKYPSAQILVLKCCDSPQTFFFRNGSDFRCSSLEASTAGKIIPSRYAFTFDDSTWTPGSDDFTFDFPTVTNVQIIAEGRGLVLAPPADKTWDFRLPVSGTGGMVAAGKGTVRLDGARWNAAGPFEIAADATLDLAASCATGLVVSGSGTLANARLVRGGLASALADDGTVTAELPVFDGVEFEGSFRVDAGRSAPLARPYRTVAVARYAGEAPDVSGWRLCGLAGVGAVFEAAEGVVRMTPGDRGLLLIVR